MLFLYVDLVVFMCDSILVLRTGVFVEVGLVAGVYAAKLALKYVETGRKEIQEQSRQCGPVAVALGGFKIHPELSA